MTVGKLKAALEGLDDGLLVVLAKDMEGNDFSPLKAFGTGCYRPESPWAGSFVGRLRQNKANPINAVCLWPVN